MKKILLVLSVVLLGTTVSQSQTVLARWNFDDSSVSYPSPSPGDGTGTITYLGAAAKATAWSSGKHGKRLSVAGFPKKSTDSSGLTGTIFSTSTSGKQGIHVCYYYKLSATASQTHQLKYSTDGGSSWTPFTFTASNPPITNVTTNGNFWADVPNSVIYDTGAQSATVWALISFDFTGIAAVNNQTNFSFLVTPVFVPGTTAYKASSGAKAYGSGGTHGFDSVTISYDQIFPVTLKGFNASVVNNTTKLLWTSENETNVASYEIEKSFDGKTFNKVTSLNPQSKSTANYSSIDVAPKGITYYRLKINNTDGSFTYSNVISVNGKAVATGVHIYPNPVLSNVTVSYAKVSNNASLLIYTTDGKLVTSSTLIEGSTQTTMDVSTLKTGKYMLTMNDGTEKQTTVLIKQ